MQESYPIQEVFRVLELKDICYTLPDGKEILKHIDLTVRDNEFMVITGPNGGGKSTLAKLIAGIVTPTSGQRHWLLNCSAVTMECTGYC